ncbi:MAG: UDP-3-O-(3-hydroxymyristoyl)glucosamine N-acyltransferase [Planctomycetes bacterium]|nr:UDP-3-O-(3-hydroxymyristoyl)glucosamine N-acyltransferase [Planctomycetota bacterium]
MSESYTVAELAAAVGGTVCGEAALRLSGIAEIDHAGPDQLTWAGDAKFTKLIPSSQAGAILVPHDADPTPMPAILCAHVESALVIAMKMLAPSQAMPAIGVHSTAVVDARARLGTDVAVGPLVVIGPGTVIGDHTHLHAGVHLGADCRVGANCVLWDQVVIRERCVLGDRVTLDAHVVIGSDGYGYTFADGAHRRLTHGGNVEIHDDVDMGAGCAIDRAKFRSTVIGRGTKLDNLVHVGHNVQIGAHCLIMAGAVIGGSTTLEDGVVIGGNAGLSDHVTLGRQVQVVGMSTVWSDLAAGMVASGIPARDHREHLRELATLRRGSALLARVKKLTQRVEQLEASADHLDSR